MKQVEIREGARRQHRMVALLAVVQSWLREVDGIVFDRKHLERLLGLKRFKGTRVEWLQEDLKEFFPYQTTYWYSSPSSFASIFLSRRTLDNFLPPGRMSDELRIAGILPEGPRLALFDMWPKEQSIAVVRAVRKALPYMSEAGNYDERVVSSFLALLAQGVISPRSLPKSKK